jgi:hypothetical protein
MKGRSKMSKSKSIHKPGKKMPQSHQDKVLKIINRSGLVIP